MATYTTITTTNETIGVLFNDVSPLPNQAKGATFKRSELIEVWHENEPMEHIRLVMGSGDNWRLALSATGDIIPVTSVKIGTASAVIPTTIEELHTELNKLFI